MVLERIVHMLALVVQDEAFQEDHNNHALHVCFAIFVDCQLVLSTVMDVVVAVRQCFAVEGG